MERNADVPRPLKAAFVFHCIADCLVAIPLMACPAWFLGLLGWSTVDPFAARIAAAALFGIGIESYLGRNAGIEAYRGMLNLKIIWSLAAAAGILWSLLEGAQGGPAWGWALFFVFALFNVLWVYWRLKAGRFRS